ncbi:hypothetical protein T08_2189 [Trichinella sp. T8]|nr:hypothetical protein T08_2189 [Trichinella sp. T8]
MLAHLIYGFMEMEPSRSRSSISMSCSTSSSAQGANAWYRRACDLAVPIARHPDLPSTLKSAGGESRGRPAADQSGGLVPPPVGCSTWSRRTVRLHPTRPDTSARRPIPDRRHDAEDTTSASADWLPSLVPPMPHRSTAS